MTVNQKFERRMKLNTPHYGSRSRSQRKGGGSGEVLPRRWQSAAARSKARRNSSSTSTSQPLHATSSPNSSVSVSLSASARVRLLQLQVDSDRDTDCTTFVTLLQCHTFQRSSRSRRPVRRVKRAKGSPLPPLLAKLHKLHNSRPDADAGTTLKADLETSGRVSSDSDSVSPPAAGRGEGCGQRTGGDDEMGKNTISEAGTHRQQEYHGEKPGERERQLPAIVVTGAESQNSTPTCRRKLLGRGAAMSVRQPLSDPSVDGSPPAKAHRTSASARRRHSGRDDIRDSVWDKIDRPAVRQSSVDPTTDAQRNAAPKDCSVPYRPQPFASYGVKRRRRRRLQPRQMRRRRKVVVAGEMYSGKTGLISAYCRDRFPASYVPTILTSCSTDADVMGEKIGLIVVEVPGRKDFAKIRPCAYHKMDAIILCYSVDDPASLTAIQTDWLPELKSHAPKVPYILVGTKMDKKDEVDFETSAVSSRPSGGDSLHVQNIVSTAQGLEASKRLGAQDFLECSALYRNGTRAVFETAAKVALTKHRKKKGQQRAEPCIIL